MIREFIYKTSARYFIFIRSLYSNKADRDGKLPALIVLTLLANAQTLIMSFEYFADCDLGLRRMWLNGSGIKSLLSPLIGLGMIVGWTFTGKFMSRLIEKKERYKVLRSLLNKKHKPGLTLAYLIVTFVVSLASFVFFISSGD